MRCLTLALLLLITQAVGAQMPLPPELGGRNITPIENPTPDALRTLSDLLDTTSPDTSRSLSPSIGDRQPTSVQRLYARARQLILKGDHADAVPLLQQAIELAPSNAQLHRELALALIPTGQIDEAREVLDRAIELGVRDARSLYIAGSLDARRGDLDRAQGLLLDAVRAPMGDDALAALVYFALAKVLESNGHTLAASQATIRAVERMQRMRARSVYESELARIYDARAVHLERTADTLMRLGQPAQAADAYALARDLGASVVSPLLYKQIAALIGAHRPDEAADVLIDACASPSYRMDDRLIRCVELFTPAQRTRIARALIPLREHPWCVRSARAWLDRVIARALPPEDARDLLRSILDADPTHARALEDLLRSYDSDAARGRELAALIADDPRLFTTIERVARLTRAAPPAQILADAPSVEARLARAALLIAHGRANEALALLEQDDPVDQRVQQARALASTRAGRIEDMPPPLRIRKLGSLARQAWAMIFAEGRNQAAVTRILENPDTPADELLRGTLQLRSAGAGALTPSLRAQALRLLDLDPTHPEALELLVHMSRSDPDLGARIGTIFREHAGGARLRRILACEQLLARGDRAKAENLLSDLVLEYEEPDRALELLARLWMTAPLSQREAALVRGVQFCKQLLDERPPSVQLLLTHAQLLEQLGRRDEAIASLDGHTSPRVQRAREEIMLRKPEQAESAAQLRTARLARPNPTLDERAERIAEACAQRDLIRAITHVESLIPKGITLDTWQSRVISDALAVPAAEIAREPDGPLAAPFNELVGRLIDHDCALSTDLLQLHLALLARHDTEPLDALARTSVDIAHRLANPNMAEQMAMTPVRVLVSRELLDEALRLIEDITRTIEVRDPRFVELWTGLVIQAGNSENTQTMLTRVRTDQALRAVFTSASFGDIDDLSGPLLRAEIAFQIGTAHASIGKSDAAEGDYRIGLRLNPRHPWCANNLGYGMLERGGDLDEAERLITIAYEQLPDNGSVVDSMGWVRYLRGQIHDEIDEQGKIVREGAVTLLARAVELGGEDAGAVVLDHLGDALWRSGRRDDAIDTWRRALSSARLEHETLARTAPPEHPDLLELEDLLTRLESKIASGEHGTPPPIAPVRIETPSP